MIILDTNVISELMQRDPRQAVIDWLDRQEAGAVFPTSITVYELEFGVRLLAEGTRRAAIENAVQEMITESFSGRVLPFDTRAAREAARFRFRSEEPVIRLRFATFKSQGSHALSMRRLQLAIFGISPRLLE